MTLFMRDKLEFVVFVVVNVNDEGRKNIDTFVFMHQMMSFNVFFLQDFLQ